jgi:hypothetical protein
MKTMQNSKRQYKTFDQTEAILKAQKLIDNIKKSHKNMRSIRIDSETIIQLKPERKNINQIVERVKNKRRTISLIEQIEYGHYA